MSTTKVVIGVLAGAAVGALLGVLFAPDKGSVTRKKLLGSIPDTDDLKQKFDELLNDLSEKYEAAKEDASDLYEHEKRRAEEITREIKSAMN